MRTTKTKHKTFIPGGHVPSGSDQNMSVVKSSVVSDKTMENSVVVSQQDVAKDDGQNE